MIKTNYRPDIDGLRAVAILSVVIFHLAPTYLSGGFVGVDIFFVISGFLISRILLAECENGKFSLAAFYQRRIIRIFPALLLVCLCCCIAGGLILLPVDYQSLFRQIVAGGFFSSNFLFWQEAGYFDAAAETKPLLHLWSLGVEEQFYIFWPLLLYFAHKQKWRILPIILSIIVGSFLIDLVTMHAAPAANFYLPFSRMWELGIGGVVAYFFQAASAPNNIYQKWLHAASYRHYRNSASVLGAAMIAKAFLFINSQLPYPGVLATLPTLGTALLIAAGEHALVNRIFLKQRLAVFIGLISYPLYLWHWPLIAFTRQHYPVIPHSVTAVLLLASFLLAYLTYEWVEKPLRRTKEHGARIRYTKILIGLMATLLAASGIGIIKDGFSSRMPPIFQMSNMIVTHQMMEDLWREGRCFFLDPNNEFSPECVDAPQHGPLVALWGDSHAAALFPGLHALQLTHHFRLAQFTIASCPPILGMIDSARFGTAQNQCATRNEQTLQTLIQLKPQILIISAHWSTYYGQPHHEENFANFQQTLAQLKQAGIKKIILIGPVPLWPMGSQIPLFHEWLKDRNTPLPTRTFDGMVSVDVSETKVKQIALAAQADYISPTDVLCNKEGCLMRLGDTINDLIFWDNGHFTKQGSIYFAKQLFDQNLIAP